MGKVFQRIQYGLMALLFMVATLATSIVLSPQASALAGDGTEANPWQIANCTDLQDLNNDVSYYDDYFVLTNDINCNGVNFSSIDFGGNAALVGHFDGADHKISNLAINNSFTNEKGLFRYIANNATIVNLTIENASVSGDGQVGILAGMAEFSTIENVTITSGSVTSTGEAGGSFGGLIGTIYDTDVFNVVVDVDINASDASMVGGLVGYVMQDSNLGQIASLGDVEGNSHVGGLVGTAQGASFDKAFATGNVIAHTGPGGGLVGTAEGGSSFIGTYARGNVTGSGYLGGHTGYAGSNTEIGWAYATGLVTPQGGESIAGGLVGGADDMSTVQADSFWDTETSGLLVSAGAGEVGKTTAEMKDMNTYIPFDWNFDDYWFQGDAVNDGYLCQIWYQVCYDAFTGNTGGGSSNLPNNGDGNNDGIIDEEQDNVTTILNPVSSKYVTVAVDESCALSDVSIANASAHTAQDNSIYSYQSGFVNFTATGCDNNTANVKIYYHGVSPSSLIARKYNPNTSTYFTISSAAITAATSPLSGTVVSYAIADNGELDINPTTGVITDPVGLAAVAAPAAPNTGFAPQSSATYLVITILISLLLGAAALQYKYSKQ